MLKKLNLFARCWKISQKKIERRIWKYPLNRISQKPHPVRGGRRLRVERQGRFLKIQGNRLQVLLNCQRGLAVESFVDFEFSKVPLFGTLHHGYFDNIQWAADFYSGFLVWEGPGKSKVTDLVSVTPECWRGRGQVEIACQISTPMGEIKKIWFLDNDRGVAQLSYQLNWPKPSIGSLRLGHLLLKPEGFEKNSLRYVTHNGGYQPEIFRLGLQSFDHGKNVSSLVSANTAVGLTGGVVGVGDRKTQINIQIEQEKSVLVGMITHHLIGRSYLTRVALSARELDDTSKRTPIGHLTSTLKYFASSNQNIK